MLDPRCGHENDIVCVLSEMEELMNTIDWVLDFAEDDGETLVHQLFIHPYESIIIPFSPLTSGGDPIRS